MALSGWSVETIKRQIAPARGAGMAALAKPPGAPGTTKSVGRRISARSQ